MVLGRYLMVEYLDPQGKAHKKFRFRLHISNP